MRHDNILSTVGNTPVVALRKLAPDNVELFGKLEAFNPMGSVKDRLALGVIEDAERRGTLRPGQTVIEATSGNTGIGLAMVCAQKGYPLVVTMAESFSVERRRLMRFLGARVVLTPAALKGSGMLAKAMELAAEHDWFLVRQFENEANADAHSRTTAPEILAAFDDAPLDYFVTGFGTGGTLKGVARVLRERSPATKIIVCEPDNSPILGSGIAQARNADGSIADSHPLFRPHLMQGWSPDFIPQLTEDATAANYVDEIVAINGDDALECARRLATEEGILAGISAGATVAGGLAIAGRAAEGARILCMLPDTGERYLSTVLFEDIAADMNEEESRLSQSTPNYRFDSAPPPPPAADSDESPAASNTAREFLQSAINDADNPVVMFSHEWCEFCWSVRRMYADYGIAYRSVDLDSVAFQKDNLGGDIRAAIREQTGAKTIPQIYIGGRYIGGATEMFDAARDGTMARLFDDLCVEWNRDVDTDPYSYLPGWLHAR